MAELETSCCTPAEQTACYEPEDKASCCGDQHADGCGCPAGAGGLSSPEALRETVREKYAEAARAAAAGAAAGCCTPADQTGGFGSALYADTAEGEAPEGGVSGSLGW